MQIRTYDEIDFLFGEYDCIFTAQSTDTATLARLITTRIRQAPGVLQTVTLLEAPFAQATTRGLTGRRQM